MALYCSGSRVNKQLWRQVYQIYHIRHMYTKKSEIYKKCFNILGLSEDADQNTVRKRYIELVKKVHPDSGTDDASIDKFREVDEAFKVLQGKFAKNRRGIYDEEQEIDVFDIKHTAPQHRQYLSFDGVGIGTVFQRQRQYDQFKVLKAQERVMEHRISKIQTKSGDLMKKNPQHHIKTKYGFDRVVEDLIQEAMANGDFNELSGAGKPLPNTQTQHPYLDFTTHKLNKILIDNGFTPKWITLQRDIRNEIDELRKNLVNQRQYLGETPLSETDAEKWELIVASYEKDVEKINKFIDEFNLIVPIINKQLFRIKMSELARDVLDDTNISHSKEPLCNKNFKENNSSNFLSFFWSLF